MMKRLFASHPLLLFIALVVPHYVWAQTSVPLTLVSANPAQDGRFGTSVAAVGDIDGDGRGDLLVGTIRENGGAMEAGRAYLFSGATGALLRELMSPSPEVVGQFGFSVSSVRDADGDGQDDLLIGAFREDGGAVDAGRAYLFSGATGALLHTLVSPNPLGDGFFGASVAGVADADGDGRGDLLGGARSESGGAERSGRAYLFSGANGTLLRTLVSPNPEQVGQFGILVAGVPDANGDGRGDLLVGASSEDGGAEGAGRAYLFSGATGALLHTLMSPNPEAFGNFGLMAAGVADADGDGAGDLLVGAPSEDGGADGAGRAYLFSGATGTLLRTLASPNAQTNGQFGVSMAGAADADGDGRGDLLVGTRFEDGGALGAGRAYLFSGATGVLLRTLESPNPEAGGSFGQSVAGVADANGDGQDDLLVGAYSEDGGALNAGRAYLFSGAVDGGGGAVQDSLALVALYNATDGPNWARNANWLTGPLNSWQGITLDAEGRVVTVALASNQLNGTLPPEIGQLERVQNLRLQINALSGPIPSEIGDLADLEILSLFLNELSGEIPPEIGQLGQLTSLGLGENQLSGEIPAQLGQLENLLQLDINGNQISGPLPAELGGLVTLESLVINNNPLSGPIPLSFVALTALNTFRYAGTDLCAPEDAAFQKWLSGVDTVEGTGVTCSTNQPPVAVDDTATTQAGTSVFIDVLANDTDPDGDVLTIAGVGSPANGTAEDFKGRVRYTPSAGFTGTDSFTYTVSDGNGGMNDALVTVTVEGGPGGSFDVAPAAVTATLNQGENTTVALTLTNNSAQTAAWAFPACEDAPVRGVEPAHRGPQPHLELTKGQKDPRPGHAPRFGSGGPDGFGYRWIDSNEPGGPTYGFVDISETGTALELSDDEGELVPLPFTFSFYGDNKTEVIISSNGFLTFGPDGSDFTNDPIPDPAEPNDFIAAFWDDLDPRAEQSAIYYQDMGDGRFVVQYEMILDYPASSNPGTEKTFEIILDADGSILLQYEEMNEDLLGATIGIENADGTDGLEIAFKSAYVENGLAVRIDGGQPLWITGPDPACGTLGPSESVAVDLGLNAVGLDPGTYTFGLSLETDVPGSEQLTAPITLTVTGADVVVEAPAEAPTNTGVPIAVTVTGFTPTVAELRYRPSGASAFSSVPLALNGTSYAGTVPQAAVTLRGVDYYIFLSDGERIVTFPANDPELNPDRVRVRVDRQVAEITLPPNAEYRMVSVPIALADPSPAAVFGDDYGEYGETSWRLLRWLPAGGYAEFPSITSPVTPGTAFWLAAYADAPFDVEDGLSVDATDPVAIILQPGWNQIGDPFAFPVAWDDVEGSALVQPPALYDGTEYLLDQTVLDPWAGYFVLNNTGESVTLRVPPVDASDIERAAARSAVGGEGYRLHLRADVPERGLRDSQNVFGFAEADAGQLNRAEPPPIGPHLRLSAVEEGVRLAHSFRPVGSDGADWELEVAVTPGLLAAGPLTVRVALEEDGARPTDYNLYVLDLDRTAPIPLGDEALAFDVTLSAAEPVRRLRLIAGTEAYADAARQGIPLVPLDFALAPAYPNPFTRSATLTYQLAERADVRLEVFDLLGRRVAVLADGSHDAGRYTVQWDGVTAAGAPLASGVYVYRLRAGDFTASQKMVLLR